MAGGSNNRFEQNVFVEEIRIEPTGDSEGFIGLIIEGLRVGKKLVSYFITHPKEKEILGQLQMRIGKEAKVIGHTEDTRNRRAAKVVDTVEGPDGQ